MMIAVYTALALVAFLLFIYLLLALLKPELFP